jgi:hypothetical protein
MQPENAVNDRSTTRLSSGPAERTEDVSLALKHFAGKFLYQIYSHHNYGAAIQHPMAEADPCQPDPCFDNVQI